MEENNTVTIKYFLHQLINKINFLRRKWLIIFSFSIIGALFGLWIGIVQKPVYKAALSFALEEEGLGSGSAAMGLASQLGLDIGGSSNGAFKGSNVIELFKSRIMIQKTLQEPVSNEKYSLADLYIKVNNWKQKWSDEPLLNKITIPVNKELSRIQDSVLGLIYDQLIKKDLTVGQRDKKNSVIYIETKSKSEDFSKQFTEKLAVIVSDFYIETKSKKARQNLAILQHQVDSVRNQLSASVLGVAVSTEQTFGLNPALNVQRVPSAKKQIEVQTNTAVLTELLKQTEIAKINVRKETPLIQVIDKPILPLEKERIGKLKGFIFGGLLAGFIIVFGLLGKQYFREIVNE